MPEISVFAPVALELACYFVLHLPAEVWGVGMLAAGGICLFRAALLRLQAQMIEDTPVQCLESAVRDLRESGQSVVPLVVVRTALWPSAESISVDQRATAVMWWRAVSGYSLGPAWGGGLATNDVQLAQQSRHVHFMLQSGIEYIPIELNGLECDPRNISSDMYISFIQGSPMLVHAIEDAFLSSVEVTAIGELAIDRQSPFSFLPSSVCPSISAPVIFRASSNPIFRKAFVTERHPFEIATELKRQGRQGMWMGWGLVVASILVLGASGWGSVQAALKRRAEAAQRAALRRRLTNRDSSSGEGGGGGGQHGGASAGEEEAEGERERREEEQQALCVVCFERHRDAVLLPCAHQVLCEECARVLPRVRGAGPGARVLPLCPICRTPIESLLRVNTLDLEE
mmetsp:Transcript_28601/g.67741  ORF Transcript_28601/g.67741 Transcript_28601/m.67741 type:complete len:400 (-) Transcript_28601:159-1358(-)